MTEGFPRHEADTRRASERRRDSLARRPDRIALWAFALAVTAMALAAASAYAGSGGMAATSPTSGGTTTTRDTHDARYKRIWDSFGHRAHHWARTTSECEAGGDPKAIGGGGRYRGAFQFTKPTWKTSPRSPGGDPIRYPWKTQAVVAVLLKHHEGTKPWPVCG